MQFFLKKSLDNDLFSIILDFQNQPNGDMTIIRVLNIYSTNNLDIIHRFTRQPKKIGRNSKLLISL